MYKLLQALDFSHSCGVMHRDVKPRNVIINHATRELRLIDWGLGDFYIPGRRYAVRVGSRYYKAPELLCGYRYYDYSVDMFSAGCVLAGLLLRREPFFRGRDNEDQLVRICCVLGTAPLHAYLKRYGVVLDAKLAAALDTHAAKDWWSFVNSDNSELVSDAAFDLLSRMLRFDHQERISAKAAMAHAFFDDVRGEIAASLRDCGGGGSSGGGSCCDGSSSVGDERW
eukprot:TRINITY_DN375_c0_g2_i3.p2 TRINITY_DN375_c0_g2~~TRINITY_DN375_c0_g2_i3.p2  ORF type:complete len:226 (-),score=90.88 TRINITY_DN375_c0_g2_i3:316-993(-)